MDFSDLGEIGKVLSYMAPVIVFLVINVFFKKQQEQKRKVTVIRSLLSDINHNQKLIETSSIQLQMKKFKTGTWKRNKGKIDYISPDLYNTLADTYEIAEEFNQDIDAAKKYKSTSYLVGIPMDRLRKPLDKSAQGLEEWLQENKGRKESSKSHHGLSS